MISVKFDSRQFMRDMNNIMEYSAGFLEGANRGKQLMLNNVGKATIELIKDYIDAHARVNPNMLHHMYEWQKTGSPQARLFDIDYNVSGMGLSIKSTFRQSTSIKKGSTVPFYDKARIMEYGIPVKITPKKASVLAFEDNGETVFTSKEVAVDKPGGSEVAGSYERVFDSFFTAYFSQAFLLKTGILGYIEDTRIYKKNLRAGKSLGRPKGITTGYRWIANLDKVN